VNRSSLILFVFSSLGFLAGCPVPTGKCTEEVDGLFSPVTICFDDSGETGFVDSGDTGRDTSIDTDSGTDTDDTGITPVDADGDGHASVETGGDDCDDGNAGVYPGADEACNGADDDCDDDVDEDLVFADYYADADLDGYGDEFGAASSECEDPGMGFSTSNDDCDDTDDTVHPYADEACDDTVDLACDDCDDTNAASFPDNVEVCDDVDNDCDIDVDEDATDAITWYADSDGDTYGDPDDSTVTCDAPTGYVADGTDCNDSEATAHPGGMEICDSGDVDEDCDGEAEESDALGRTSWHEDSDGDGYGSAGVVEESCDASSSTFVTTASGDEDCDDSDPAVNVAATETCNGVDDNCDGDIDEEGATGESMWYADTDGDGYGDSAASKSACDQPDGYEGNSDDCDDADGDINPDAIEVCDGADQDCDGSSDEDLVFADYYPDADLDGYGDEFGSASSECEDPGTGFSTSNDDCDDGDDGINPDASEIVSDGIDQDCDGADSTEPDVDSDGYGESVDCDDGDASVNPGAVETCDGIDNDCSGTPDDGLATATYYADGDADGYGDSATGSSECADPGTGYSTVDGDCDDADGDINPDALEVCDDADTDEDCNGSAEESGAAGESTWYADTDGDGYGDSVVWDIACDAPSGYVGDATDCDDGDPGTNPGEAEIEGDGIDQDCDGLETFYSEDFGSGSGSCTVGDFERSDGGTIHQTGSCWILIQEGGTTTAPSVSIDVTLTGMSIGVDYTFTWEVANEYSSSVTIVADADRGTPDTGTFALSDTGTLETTWTADATSVTARIWTTGTSYYDGVLTGFVVTQE
jgi:large repetitive protein